MSTNSGRGIPPYARVFVDIRARIDSGELRPGDRVPSTREITREWGVAMATATKALTALRREGLVEAVRGVGTVVRGEPDSDPTPTSASALEGHEPERRRERRSRTVPALTREAIVGAAITVADAEGIEGLSMRRVSSELRVSTMALYRHVADKGELMTAMIDRVYTDAALPEPPPDHWREALELALVAEWGIYREHPWAMRLTMMAGAVVSPGLMRNAEWMMRVITHQGRSADEAQEILVFVSAYTSGMALQATRVVLEDHEFGMDADQWWRSRAPEFLRLAAGGGFPVMFSVSGPLDVDGVFEAGMKHLLDGLTPRIEGTATP
ncbi:GntR family transcriptional regulator [Nocardiopsis sp. NPDC055879]